MQHERVRIDHAVDEVYYPEYVVGSFLPAMVVVLSRFAYFFCRGDKSARRNTTGLHLMIFFWFAQQ